MSTISTLVLYKKNIVYNIYILSMNTGKLIFAFCLLIGLIYLSVKKQKEPFIIRPDPSGFIEFDNEDLLNVINGLKPTKFRDFTKKDYPKLISVLSYLLQKHPSISENVKTYFKNLKNTSGTKDKFAWLYKNMEILFDHPFYLFGNKNYQVVRHENVVDLEEQEQDQNVESNVVVSAPSVA